MSQVEIRCINCENRAPLEIPNNSEVVQCVGMEKVPAIKKEGDNYRISVCPHGCGASTVAVLRVKNRDTSGEE